MPLIDAVAERVRRRTGAPTDPRNVLISAGARPEGSVP